MSYFVGLTGGIGSGKSTVAGLFSKLGVPVIDTDAISHQLTAPHGAAISAIESLFGAEYIDQQGALNRAKMRERVFNDNAAKTSLESILHPLILQQTKAQASASHAPYVLIVVPLLLESGHYKNWINRILTVDCSETMQIRRASQRPGLEESTVKAIMANQLPRTTRLELSDDVIHNDGPLSELERQIFDLHQIYLKNAQTNN